MKEKEYKEYIYKKANEVSNKEQLDKLLDEVLNDKELDYGKIVYAISACMIATANCIDRSEVGGITGFQSNYITFWLERYHVDSMPSGFVVYNYNKKEVVFAHRLFTPEQTGKGRYLRGNTTRIPFYNNGLIYVHDNCDTLHIFEDVKE